ncbi:MAG: GNAT family N-acetyltransferase [Duncaniella sp.]|nr:GNAT family N-acetyltransferase [Duncaniella sp.]
MERDILQSGHSELIPDSIGCGICSLRPLAAEDQDALLSLLGEDEVAEYLGRGEGYAEALIEGNIAGDSVNMAVVDGNGAFAGFVSAVPVIDCHPSMPRWNLEFAVSAGFCGRGFATAAVDGICSFLLKNFALPRIVADICDADRAAVRVIEKCGFVRPSHRYSYMNYRNVRQGMRWQWYRMQPGRRALCFAKGMQYYRMGRFTDAATMWLESLASPRCDDTPYSDGLIMADIGMAYSSAGWYTQARKYLERASVMTDDASHIEGELRWIASLTEI